MNSLSHDRLSVGGVPPRQTTVVLSYWTQFLLIVACALFSAPTEANAQIMQLKTSQGRMMELPVQEMTAYRLLWSEDLRTWQWLGDTFLPDASSPVELPVANRMFFSSQPQWPLKDKKLRVVLIGDSTISDLSPFHPNWAGWGQFLQDFFDSRITVVNQAEPGLWTTRFLEQNRMASMARISPDVVIIQFGIVEYLDGHSMETFEANMALLIEAVRNIGAIPIVVTPVARRTYSDSGVYFNELVNFAHSAARVGRNMNAAVVDLNRIMAEFYESRDIVQTGFITGCGNACPDQMHYSKAGSYIIAAMATREFPALLKAYLVPLESLQDKMVNALQFDRNFAGLQTPFIDLTGFQDKEIWSWVFPQ